MSPLKKNFGDSGQISAAKKNNLQGVPTPFFIPAKSLYLTITKVSPIISGTGFLYLKRPSFLLLSNNTVYTPPRLSLELCEQTVNEAVGKKLLKICSKCATFTFWWCIFEKIKYTFVNLQPWWRWKVSVTVMMTCSGRKPNTIIQRWLSNLHTQVWGCKTNKWRENWVWIRLFVNCVRSYHFGALFLRYYSPWW